MTTLFHTTPAADTILRDGFHDGVGSYLFVGLTLQQVKPPAAHRGRGSGMSPGSWVIDSGESISPVLDDRVVAEVDAAWLAWRQTWPQHG